MTTNPTTIDAAGWLRNHLESDDAGGDLLAALVKDFAEALMSAEASAQCQAGYNERTDERANSRNGYRTRRWDTRAGTVDPRGPEAPPGHLLPGLAVDPPQTRGAGVGVGGRGGLRERGVDSPDRRRCPSHGHRGDVTLAGVTAVRRSRCEGDRVPRTTPSTAGPYRYVWIDALTQKVREGGRVVNVSAVVATAVNGEGRREIIGFDIVTTESTASSSC
jgi:putative transposase